MADKGDLSIVAPNQGRVYRVIDRDSDLQPALSLNDSQDDYSNTQTSFSFFEEDLSGREKAKAEVFIEKKIISAIDSLIDNCITAGFVMGKKDIEETFKNILNEMADYGLISAGQRNEYIKPQKQEVTKAVHTQVRVIETESERRGVLKLFKACFSREQVSLIKEEVYKNQKVIVEAPSKFEKDIAGLLKFDREEKLLMSNVESNKDILLRAIGRICATVGFDYNREYYKEARDVKKQSNLLKNMFRTAHLY